MPPKLTGYYLNLDRSPERAAFMQAQLARLGLHWVQRHAAVDGKQVPMPAGCQLLPGEYGCYLSHLQALERAPADAFTLILEDDAELGEQLPEMVAKLVDGPLDGVDVAYLECQPHYTLAHLSALWDVASRHLPVQAAATDQRLTRGIELLDARLFYKWGTNAYLVSPAGRAKLLALIPAWLAEGPVLPLDRWHERALVAQQLRGAITIPFLATTGLQWHQQSTIGDGWRSPSALQLVLRRLLYAGSLQDSAGFAQALAAAPPPADPALQMFALVLREVAGLQRQEALAGVAGPPSSG